MPLTDVQLKKAKPAEKDYWLADEKGLRVLVKASTSKIYFRMKNRFEGKQKTLALGVYPEVTPKEAREKRDAARRLLRSCIDPMSERNESKKASPLEKRFSVFAKEWWDHQRGDID